MHSSESSESSEWTDRPDSRSWPQTPSSRQQKRLLSLALHWAGERGGPPRKAQAPSILLPELEVPRGAASVARRSLHTAHFHLPAAPPAPLGTPGLHIRVRVAVEAPGVLLFLLSMLLLLLLLPALPALPTLPSSEVLGAVLRLTFRTGSVGAVTWAKHANMYQRAKHLPRRTNSNGALWHTSPCCHVTSHGRTAEPVAVLAMPRATACTRPGTGTAQALVVAVNVA